MIRPELYPYQKEAIEKIFAEWRSGKKSVLFQMPTGTGKTVVFSEITRKGDRGERNIVIVAHRRELIEQIYNRLTNQGVDAGKIVAGSPIDYSKRIQVASIFTLTRREAPQADLVIIDECHHAKAKSYQRLWETFPEAKFLGVTATPVRLSGEGFENLFDVLVPSMQTKEFINQGFLSPVKHFVCFNPDLKKVKISKGDYAIPELSQLMLENSQMASLTDSYRKHGNNKSMIVFAVNIEHSKSIVARYKAEGISAEHIDSKTPVQERTAILDRFRNGEIKVVSNVEIITEGFDFPECGVVQLARPTQSLALYLQIVGRVMRKSKEKEFGVILDNAGLWLEHGLATKQRKWSLKGKKRRGRTKHGDEIDLLAIGEEGVFREVSRSVPREVEGLELIELSEENKHLFKFEEFLREAIRKGSMLHSPFYWYRDFLDEELGRFISRFEFDYVKNRIERLATRFPDKGIKPYWWKMREEEIEGNWGAEISFTETEEPNHKKKSSLLRSPRKEVEAPPQESWHNLDEFEDEDYFDNEEEGEFWFEYVNKDHPGGKLEDYVMAMSEENAMDEFYEQHPNCEFIRFI